MIEGLRAVRVPVADLEAARGWYSALLDAAPYDGEPGVCLLSVAGGTLELIHEPGRVAIGDPAAQPPAATHRSRPGAIAFWGVDHLGLELARLAEAGIRPVEAPRPIDAVTQAALFADPSGNIVGLMQRDDPNIRRARSQRAAEKVALRNVRGKVDELVDEQRQLEKFGRLVIRVVAVVALVFAAAFIAWRSARAADWLDSPQAKEFRDRVILLALIHDESSGLDPQGYLVRTKQLRKIDADCAEVETVTLQGEKEVRRETVRACRPH